MDGDFFAWLDLYEKYAEFYETQLTDQKALLLWSWLTAPEHEEDGLVAVDGERLVGLAHVREFARPLEGDRGLFLDDLYVLEEERGKGVGHALIDAVRSSRERARPRRRAVDHRPRQRPRRRSVYDSVANRTAWVTYEIDLAREVDA